MEKQKQDITLELKGIKSKINNILKSSEDEFIHLGDTLSGFSDILASIEIECNTFVSGLMEDVSDIEVNNLKKIMDDLKNFIDQSNDSYKLVYDGTSNIKKSIDGLSSIVGNFKEEHGLLKYLNFSIKKESSKIDSEEGKVFNLLSINIEDLAYALEKSLNKIISFIKDLKSDINISDKKSIITNNQLSTFNSINVGLKLMTEKNLSLKNSIDNIGHKFVEINDYISQVVVSLQKHDIIRQQFEHILEAFTFLEDGKNKLSNEEFIFLTKQVIKVQLAQIDNSISEIEEAKLAIESSINGIYEKVSEMSPALMEFSKYEVGANDPIKVIENGIIGVTNEVGSIQKSEKQFLDMIININDNVRRLNEFIKEIEDISRDIKLISFNSQIASLHIGDMGKTLRVISDEIGSYTFVVAKKSSSISDNIKLIINNSDSLVNNMTSSDKKTTNQSKEIINKAKYSINFFDNINKTFFKSVYRISKDNNSLISDIKSMQKGLQLGDFINIINQTKDSLKRIDRNLPDENIAEASKSGLLQTLLNNYTMKSERDVHLNTIGHFSEAQFDASDDDNIELF